MENREFRTGKWNARPIGPFSILNSRFPVSIFFGSGKERRELVRYRLRERAAHSFGCAFT